MSKDNYLVGKFELMESPAPRGVPQIEIVFHIDIDGLLIVEPRDKKYSTSN